MTPNSALMIDAFYSARRAALQNANVSRERKRIEHCELFTVFQRHGWE